MEIVLATSNQNKVREFQNIFRAECPELDITVLSLRDAGITDDAVEDADTFEGNAMIKAKCAAGHGYITFADDSGICVDALGGAPGIFSARFSGVHGDDEANNALLLEKLKNTPDEERTARYVCAIACVFTNGDTFTVTGKAEGKIATVPRGNGGFGYDPLFIGEGSPKTWGEISAEEKDGKSHRANAAKLFIAELRKHLYDDNNETKIIS